MKRAKLFYKIKPTITLVLVILISSVVVVTMSLQYYFSKDLAFDATESNFRLTAEKIEQKITNLDISKRNLLKTVVHSNEILDFPKVKEQHKLLKVLTTILNNNPEIYAIYSGNKNDFFYEVINLNINKSLRKRYRASKEARWLVVKIYKEEDGVRYRYNQLIDKNHKVINTTKKIATYNPSVRPWFKEAFGTNSVIKTKPYQFVNINQKGITYAKKITDTNTVVGIDVSLESISNFLQKQATDKNQKIILFKDNSKIIASANIDKGIIEMPYKEILTFVKNKKVEKINFKMQLENEYYVYYSVLKLESKDKDYLTIMIPTDTIMKPFIDKIYNSFFISLLILTLTIPLIKYATNVLVEPIKKLENENEKIIKRDYDNVNLIETRIKEYNDLSKSLYRMSCSIKDYKEKQEELMDSFIKLIAGAIDAKSKYTGGHCERVPLLTISLANAASQCEDGIFKDFKLKTKEDRRELKIAAWLHDCGKVTTPEYVIDKATKLETIYNRIHEIRTRFEVIHRDLTISMYENIKNGANEEKEKDKLRKEHEKLQKEFTILANANIGGEFMKDEDIEKICKISQRKWTKYFDDTIGISNDEKARITDKDKTFPKEEKLINDKSEHIIKRGYFSQKEFDKYNFKMNVPKYLYNHGEIYNLTIRKGTLTDEERFKINEHIIMTIKMLEELPLPKNLQRVPEYAGAHHETLIGTGYPRKLKKENMSIPARIMAIADIFEALTATDRPYKEAKKLSESIEILSFMVKDQHIDEDIFKLFLTSGVYMKYAKGFLKEYQIDDVDISKYV